MGDGARTVLLVHGHPFNHTMWRPQVEYLSANYRVVVPDLRGYGKSSLPEGSRETRLETFAPDNLALMDSLGIQEFVLGGLSMGGQIVLEVHRQAPDRIQALLLADTFAGLDSAERRQWRFTTADRLEREGMEAYAREELAKMITSANAERVPEVAAHVMQMMATTPARGAAAALRGRAQRVNYLPLLQKLHVPTLVVVGREDVYTPLALAEQLCEQIPEAKLAIIENAGHLPNLEQPAAFNSVLASWLPAVGNRARHGGRVPLQRRIAE
ncbi:MAG TPA: alpha/beta fold hydrolase [Candidatus Acidoferrum sp.]|nr:alpha/beta fold hydrolase [Candidatus Acidoferrum sp.]